MGTFAADWHDSESIVTIASVSVSALDVAIQQTQIAIVRVASVSVSGLGIAIQQTRIGELDRFNWRNLDSIVRISSVSVSDLDVAIQ